MSTLPQETEKEKIRTSTSTRIFDADLNEMLYEQLRIKEATGDKPSLSEIVSLAWAAYKREREASAQ